MSKLFLQMPRQSRVEDQNDDKSKLEGAKDLANETVKLEDEEDSNNRDLITNAIYY